MLPSIYKELVDLKLITELTETTYQVNGTDLVLQAHTNIERNKVTVCKGKNNIRVSIYLMNDFRRFLKAVNDFFAHHHAYNA